jgi:Carbohydrate-selective porin, OprB family
VSLATKTFLDKNNSINYIVLRLTIIKVIMTLSRTSSSGILLTLLSITNITQAVEIDSLHGAASRGNTVAIEGGFTVVAQSTDDNRIEDEITASFDLLSTLKTQSGEWIIYIEGNKSPRLNGVSSLLGEANADSGSALDRDGKGRLQISELHYNTNINKADLTVGLLDATGFLDASDVANDETTQFLSASLVTNPSIEFPDYTLGASYHRDTSNDLSYTLLIASSHGLADNPNVSYSELVDISATGKGYFIATEIIMPINTVILTTGLWLNTSDHQNLNGSGNGKDSNSGLYFTVDGVTKNIKWNFRYGMADDSVSQVDDFIGIAVELPISSSVAGIGYTVTGLSKDTAAAGKDDIKQFEIYYNFDLAENLVVTPSFQLLQNSGFDSSVATYDDNINIISLRANYTF